MSEPISTDPAHLMRSVLGLTRAEQRILGCIIAESNPVTTRMLSECASVHLAVAQRAVKKLVEQEVLMQGQHNRSPGGYEYTYTFIGCEGLCDRVQQELTRQVRAAVASLQNWKNQQHA